MPQNRRKKPQGDDSRVNHPDHYQATTRDGTPLEAADVIEAFFPEDAHLSQAFKYMSRAGTKVEPTEDELKAYVRDLKKCRWWITRAIEFQEGTSE